MPANWTWACIPPILTTGNTGSFPEGAIEPGVIAGVVWPNPFPNKTIVSPGLAGVVKPGYSVGGPMKEPSVWIAAGWTPSKEKNPGARVLAGTVNCVFAPLQVSSTMSGPVEGSNGVRTFT